MAKRLYLSSKIIQLLFFPALLIIPYLPLNAQTETASSSYYGGFPYPFKTQFVKKENPPTDSGIDITTYKYVSSLPRKEIISFYRNLFLNEGFKEAKSLTATPEEELRTLQFNKGFIENIILIITDFDFLRSKPGELSYEITVLKKRDLLFFSEYNFGKPQLQNSLPTPSGAFEAVPKVKYSDTGAGKYFKNLVMYLFNGDVDEIISFYLKNMPEYGWKLKKNQPFEGRNKFADAFGNSDPYGLFKEYKIDPNDYFPGINLDTKGTVLVYEREKDICYINIVQFNDSPEALRGMSINPEYFEQYGNIFIQATVSDKQIEEQKEKLARETVRKFNGTMRDWLGY